MQGHFCLVYEGERILYGSHGATWDDVICAADVMKGDGRVRAGWIERVYLG